MLIIGAGPAGLAAALQLKSRNRLWPTVYEVRPEPSTLGGAIIVPCNGIRLLDLLGVYDKISLLAPKIVTSAAYSSHGTKLGELELGTWSATKTGYKSMRIRRTDLQNVLLDKVRQLGIPVCFGKRIVAIEEQDDGVEVTFSDGTSDTAHLLLGCDGIHSSVRSLYVDPQTSPEYSGVSSIYSFLPASSLPPSTSATTGMTSMTATFTRHGLFSVMPCSTSNDSLYWFFQYEVPTPPSGNSREGWEEHCQREEDGFKAALLGFLGDVQMEWGAFLRDVIKKTETVKFFPIFRLPLGGRWSRGRCLLLGDAAHAMQPHVGQGVSMALEDAFLLSRLLDATSPSVSLSTLFEKFDGIRRPRVQKFYGFASQRTQYRETTSPWRQWLKEVLIWALMRLVVWTSLHKLGIGEKSLLYNINDVPI